MEPHQVVLQSAWGLVRSEAVPGDPRGEVLAIQGRAPG